MNTPEQIKAAIEHPAFSHARAGDGLWRDVRFIYHRDPTSPTGVILAMGADAAIADPILRKLHNTSALSPTERS